VFVLRRGCVLVICSDRVISFKLVLSKNYKLVISIILSWRMLFEFSVVYCITVLESDNNFS